MKSRLTAVLISLLFPAGAFASFPDVPASEHENAAAVDYAELRDIVQGYPDGSFKPDRPINRAEFTKIVVRSVFTEEMIETCMRGSAAVFPDVPADAWYAKYVCTAKVYGVIQGYPDGSFKPSQDISFVEAAKIFAVALRLGNGETPGSVWYEHYARQLANRGAIPITVDRFGKKLSRGEVAELIWRLNVSAHGKKSLSYEDLENAEKDPVSFYAGKLKDPAFTIKGNHGVTWYSASEALGQIGKTAVPALISALDSADEGERTRALYALLLASQHPSVIAFTNGARPEQTDAMPLPELHRLLVADWKEWFGRYRDQWAEEQTVIQLYFVNVEDAGTGSALVGCGDSLKPVTRQIPRTQSPLRDAIENLLMEKQQRVDGLYNALAQSDLTVESVIIASDGTAEIRLGGTLKIGGVCDEPRIRAQIEQTASQFTAVKRVDIRLNGGPLSGSSAQ